MPPAYDDFYVDVNHKLRHGAMRLYRRNAGHASRQSL